MDKSIWGTKKNLFWFASFCSESKSSLRPLCFYVSIEAQFLRFFFKFFNLRIFNDKKSLDVIILLIGLKYFLLSHFCLVVLPTNLATLSHGVMLLNCTELRDSTTNIEKTSRKGTPEREQPNRSVVKKKCDAEGRKNTDTVQKEGVSLPSPNRGFPSIHKG